MVPQVDCFTTGRVDTHFRLTSDNDELFKATRLQLLLERCAVEGICFWFANDKVFRLGRYSWVNLLAG
jgi:hypothetical protein